MHIIIWEYHVKVEKRSEFEKIYSSNGAWTELFKTDTEYIETEFLQDTDQASRYLTIDRWKSKEAYKNFCVQYEKEYRSLDAQCAGLTERESLIGVWDSL